MSQSPELIPEADRPPSAHHLPTGAVLLCLTTALIWSGQAVAVKVAVDKLPVFLTALLRFLIAFPILGAVAWWRSELMVKSVREFLALAGNGLFFVVQVSMYTLGTSLTTSVRSILLINTFPFFAAIACHFFLVNQKVRTQQLVGMSWAFLGLLVLFSQQLLRESFTALGGDFVIVLAAVIMGCKIAYMKNLLGRYSPIKVIFWANLVGLCVLVPLSWGLERHLTVEWTTVTMWALAYQGLLVSVGAIFLWNYLLAHYSPNDLTVFRLLAPAVGVVAGALLLNEPLHWSLIVGGSLVLLGMWWTVRKTPGPAFKRNKGESE